MKNFNLWEWSLLPQKKCLLSILVILFSLSLSAQISVDADNRPIKQILRTIERTSSYKFFYNEGLSELEKRATLKVSDISIEKALDALFLNSTITYKLSDNNLIILTVKDAVQPQARKIQGTVLDKDGEPIIGGNVVIKGTTKGTITDFDGNFTLETPENSVLVVSYIGFVNQEVPTAGKTNLLVKLAEDTKMLDEVVVVGYGTQRKKDLTGAVAVVNVDEMKKLQTPNIGEALQGQVPGVTVTTSGSPGSSPSIKIRGVGSFSNVGPLYVVDGMILDAATRDFNPNDVESMQILKDASATALYGARGANGVIVITTKKGKDGPAKVDFTANVGVQQISNTIEMMNSVEFLRVSRQAYKNADLEWPGEPQQGQKLVNTNWQNEFFKTGITQDYNLTISGGNPNGNYLVSANYYDQDGVVQGPWHKRYSIRVNSSMKKGIFSFGENVQFARSETKLMVGSPFIDLMRMPPVIPVRNEDGSYGRGTTAYPTYGSNPIGMQELSDQRQTSNRITGNLWAELDLYKGLKYRLNLGLEYHNWFDKYIDEYEPIRYLSAPSSYENKLFERKGDFTTWIVENMVTYNATFGKHFIDALAGFTLQRTDWRNNEASVYNLTPGYWVLSSGVTEPSVNGSMSANSMMSFLGRVNYAYADRYLVQLNIRSDGSSRFGANYRYGVFPSMSLGWRLSEEKFFAPAKKVVDDIKVRASYGLIGDQQAIGNYDYATYIETGEGGIFGTDQVLVPGAIQKGRANPNLRWEQKATCNIGVDFAMLNQKLYGTFEYYHARSEDLLVQLPISWTEGTDITPWSNIGKIQNQGFEMLLGYREMSRKFKYNIAFNLNTLQNKVLYLGESFREGGVNGVNRTEEGRSISEFYLIKTAGIFQSIDEVYAHTQEVVNEQGQVVTTLIQPNAKPGDIRYEDHNKDGKIDKDDRQFVGSPLPKVEMGLNFSCEFFGFDASVFFTTVIGNSIYNNGRYWLERMDDLSNYPKDLVPWTAENGSTTTPRAYMGATDNALAYTDRWLEDGSYLRLKNLQIGYTISNDVIARSKFITKFRVYVGAQNLFTITNYKGFDPEISGGSVFGQGIDDGHYPPTRTFTAGLQMSF